MLKSPIMIEGLEFWADFNFKNNILESLKLSMYQSKIVSIIMCKHLSIVTETDIFLN